MVIKKVARAVNLPKVNPALMEKLREAEEAEYAGRRPKKYNRAQRVLRSYAPPTDRQKADQLKTMGAVDPAYLSEEALDTIAESEAFMPGQDLDAIWDSLSETQKIRSGCTERFRLELESLKRRMLGNTWQPPHRVAGRLDSRNLERTQQNVNAKIDAYVEWLSEPSRDRLKRFVEATRQIFLKGYQQKDILGIDAPTWFAILDDWIDKMIHQEIVSRSRSMGDRGIHWICGHIEAADVLFTRLSDYDESISLRDLLLYRLIAIYQDIGHAAYGPRKSFRATALHRRFSAEIFTDEIDPYRALFTHEELELARFAIATHADPSIPLKSQLMLGMVRMVDHLSAFLPESTWHRFSQYPSLFPLLDDALQALKLDRPDIMPAIKGAIRHALSEEGVADIEASDLLASFAPFEKGAEIEDYTIEPLTGVLGGVVIDWGGQELPELPEGVELPKEMTEKVYAAQYGCLEFDIDSAAFLDRYVSLFDVGQPQLRRALQGAVPSRSMTIQTDQEPMLVLKSQYQANTAVMEHFDTASEANPSEKVLTEPVSFEDSTDTRSYKLTSTDLDDAQNTATHLTVERVNAGVSSAALIPTSKRVIGGRAKVFMPDPKAPVAGIDDETQG